MERLSYQVETFSPSPGLGAGVIASSYYASRDADVLVSIHSHISRSDTADVAYLRRSMDNGRSWCEPALWPTKFDAPGGTGRRHHGGGYVDPQTGRYLNVWIEGILPHDDPLEGLSHWVLFYSVAEDGASTTTVCQQIVADGSEFDERHPLPGVTVGKNCVMIGDTTCRPLTLSDGRILWPVQSSPIGPDGNYWNPGGGFTYTDALVLHGRWSSDGRIAWQASDRVKGDPHRSTRGLIEPTLAQLADGKILMVMRGSNDGRPELPGYKWASLSEDSGYTWSPPVPWTFTDGTPFFSPSACSQLLHHSSGKLLWVGNICHQNPKGNSPRYPLVVGEVAQDSGLLILDTVRLLDDRKPGESAHLTLSNFYVREDRETGELLLHMTRFFAQAGNCGTADWTADALLYRIGLDRQPFPRGGGLLSRWSIGTPVALSPTVS